MVDLYTQQDVPPIDRKRTDRAVLESEEHLHAIVQTTPECVAVIAADGTLLQMNPAGLAMVQAKAACDVVGQNILSLIAVEYRNAFTAFHHRVCHGEHGTMTFDFIGLDGARRHMEAQSVPLRIPNGAVAQLALIRDITEQKRTQESRARLSAIVDFSTDAIISKDLKGIITSWNKSACRLFGYTPEEAIGRSITMLIPPGRIEEERRILERIKRGQRVETFETCRVRKDGTSIDISLTISPIKDEQGHIIGASKIVRDITEQKRIERALRASEQRLKEVNNTLEQRVTQRTAELARQADELRRLTAQLNTAEQRERSELSRVLHDNLQQILAVARMRIDMAVGRVEDPGARDRLREAMDYIDQTIGGMRTLAAELSPPMLYYAGLVPTLQWLARHLEDNYGLRIDLQTDRFKGKISYDLRAFVYQSIRELTFNVIKHAQTDHAQIHLECNRLAGYLEVTVQDNGKGCDPARIMAQPGDGFGLTSIRERLYGLGGAFELRSSPAEGGCSVTMRIPFDGGRRSVLQKALTDA